MNVSLISKSINVYLFMSLQYIKFTSLRGIVYKKDEEKNATDVKKLVT